MHWIDGHCDVLWRMWEDPQKNFYKKNGGLDVTYEFLIQSQVKLQMFAIFVPPSISLGQKCKEAFKQLDLFYHRIIGNAEKMVLIRKMNEVHHLAPTQCGAMLALEGADVIEGDLSLLRIFYHLGVRQVGLTWNHANEVADGIMVEKGRGLSDFGKELLQEMTRLKMVVDVSHLSEAGFWDVIEQFPLPVVASHSNCRTICPHVRNLTDEQLEAIIQKNGLIGINFVPFFVAEKEAKFTKIFAHIDHILSLGGENHLFFGSDFDGAVQKISGLENMKQLNHFKDELFKRYKEESVQKWGFQNSYRFYNEHLG